MEPSSVPGTDSRDHAILNVLLQNSRLSFREIAKRVKVSVATVLHRVRVLEKVKVISGYSVRLNYELLGFDVQAVVELRVSSGKLFEVEHKIARHPGVMALYDVTGDFDAILICKFRSRKTLDAFVKKIQQYDFVERTNTKLILNVIKEEPIVI